MEALQDALALEVEVTQSIRELITTCENVETRRNKNEIENDYHVIILIILLLFFIPTYIFNFYINIQFNFIKIYS